MRSLVALLACSVLFGQNPKPTLNTVEADVKKAAEDQSKAAQLAKELAIRTADDQANAARLHRASLNEVLAKQLKSERAALLRSHEDKDSAALASFKQELRLLAIEKAISAAEAERVNADKKAEASRDELFAYLSKIVSALIIAGLLWLAKMGYSLIVDGRRARAAQAQLKQIHTLVNSNMTVAMENEFVAVKSSLASLLEVRRLSDKAGEPATTESDEAIASLRKHIAQLSMELHDRAVNTAKAEEELNRAA